MMVLNHIFLLFLNGLNAIILPCNPGQEVLQRLISAGLPHNDQQQQHGKASEKHDRVLRGDPRAL